MKTLLTALAVMTVALTTAAQQPANPPMKMGLWESKSIVTLGSDLKDTPVNHERTMRNCVTPENWLKMMGPTGPHACPKVNEVWMKDAYSFDVQCSGKPKIASINVHFIDPLTERTMLDMYTTPGGEPMANHMEIDEHWVSDACGDVTPGHPVLIR